MAIPDPDSRKSLLRASMRRALRGRKNDSTTACEALHHWLLARPGLSTVAVYSPLPGEVDLSATVARHPLVRWVYPKVAGHDLTLHPGGNLVPGAFGISEPDPASPEIPVEEIDAIVCPGLAFDPTGGRLGRGRGFYDRLLARVRPDTHKVGVCFPDQLVPDTFPEPHDIRMDEVLF